MKENLRWWYDS